jgi:hypothetical protein
MNHRQNLKKRFKRWREFTSEIWVPNEEFEISVPAGWERASYYDTHLWRIKKIAGWVATNHLSSLMLRLRRLNRRHFNRVPWSEHQRQGYASKL